MPTIEQIFSSGKVKSQFKYSVGKKSTYGQWQTDSGQFGGYRMQLTSHQSRIPGKIRYDCDGIQT